MNLLDLFVILIAAMLVLFAHAPLGITVLLTLGALIVFRLIRGERVP